jgi:GTP cyclohydrolase I
MRAAKALQFLTGGYCQSVSEVIGEGVFNEETNNDMVLHLIFCNNFIFN